MNRQRRKLKRISTLVGILSKYGFTEVLVKMNLKSEKPAPEESGRPVYVRVRKVLEELGPAFVKLGQAFANRDDLLPKELTAELQNLQDSTQFADIDIRAVLADNFGENYGDYFEKICEMPIASASIAQVYEAELKGGQKAALKVKRPGIREVIEDDLMLMKDLAKTLSKYSKIAQNINLQDAVDTFEKTLLNELSLVNERENIERMAINFKGNPKTKVPKIFAHLCNDDVLCMEFIEGKKITDFRFLNENHLTPKKLAYNTIHLFLAQVLEYGFFHADPHDGNIFATADGKIAFIDFGAMGSIHPSELENLENFLINASTKNTKKVVQIIKKIAVKIDIKDEKKLETQIGELITMVENTPLEQLNLAEIINSYKNILFENRIVMPDYLFLLWRGIMLIEGVGRTLDPTLNVMRCIKPYVQKIIHKRLSIRYLMKKNTAFLSELVQNLQTLPQEYRNIIYQLNEGKFLIQTEERNLQKTNKLIEKSLRILVAAMLLSALIIAAAVGFSAGNSAVGIPALVLAGVLSIFLLFQMWKKS